jgi:hypothetical protein
VNAHDDLVSINIDVSLHQRHRLIQHIVTGTQQVNVENLVVSHHAKYSFIVVRRFLGVELNDNSDLGVGVYCAFSFRESEDV